MNYLCSRDEKEWDPATAFRQLRLQDILNIQHYLQQEDPTVQDVFARCSRPIDDAEELAGPTLDAARLQDRQIHQRINKHAQPVDTVATTTVNTQLTSDYIKSRIFRLIKSHLNTPGAGVNEVHGGIDKAMFDALFGSWDDITVDELSTRIRSDRWDSVGKRLTPPMGLEREPLKDEG